MTGESEISYRVACGTAKAAKMLAFLPLFALGEGNKRESQCSLKAPDSSTKEGVLYSLSKG